MNKHEILNGTAMVTDPATDGGQVSRDPMPVETARQYATVLEAAGFTVSWAPDADDRSVAYLYVA